MQKQVGDVETVARLEGCEAAWEPPRCHQHVRNVSVEPHCDPPSEEAQPPSLQIIQYSDIPSVFVMTTEI